MSANKASKEALRVLKKILKPVNEALEYENTSSPPQVSLKNIPFLSRIMEDVGESGNAIMQLRDSVDILRDAAPSESLTLGMQFGAVALAIVDFLLIPIVYLASYVVDKKIPISLNNNARWMYSALLLALAITAAAVPPVAATLALVSAVASLALSVFLLGRVVYERYQLGLKRRAISKMIARAEDEMELIQTEAEMLHTALIQAIEEKSLIKRSLQSASLRDHPNLQKKWGEANNHLFMIFKHIALLEGRYQAQITLLKEFKAQEFDIKQEIKEMWFLKVLDRGIGLSLAAMGVVGAVVSLFFPPVGFAIIAAVALTSLAYIVARLSVPLFKFLGHWIASKLQSSSEDNELIDGLDQQLDKTHEQSTHSMIAQLSGGKKAAIEILRKELLSVEPPTSMYPELMIHPEDRQDEDDNDESEGEKNHFSLQ